MADWTWKRHWLADYQRQQDIAMNQVIDECLSGDNRELRPPRRMSGASVAQVIDEGPMVVMLHQLVRPEWWISS